MLTPFILTQVLQPKPVPARRPSEVFILHTVDSRPVSVASLQYSLPPAQDELTELVPVSPSYTTPNEYEPGQCVWAVYQWRGNIPGSWGNAKQWLGHAQAEGWQIGPSPQVGAIGWKWNGDPTSNGHVVLVTAVYGSTIQIREMNYDFVPYHERYRLADVSEFYYIY
jgi:surface antigen